MSVKLRKNYQLLNHKLFPLGTGRLDVAPHALLPSSGTSTVPLPGDWNPGALVLHFPLATVSELPKMHSPTSSEALAFQLMIGLWDYTECKRRAGDLASEGFDW